MLAFHCDRTAISEQNFAFLQGLTNAQLSACSMFVFYMLLIVYGSPVVPKINETEPDTHGKSPLGSGSHSVSGSSLQESTPLSYDPPGCAKAGKCCCRWCLSLVSQGPLRGKQPLAAMVSRAVPWMACRGQQRKHISSQTCTERGACRALGSSPTAKDKVV